jgi:hypothetical protein
MRQATHGLETMKTMNFFITCALLVTSASAADAKTCFEVPVFMTDEHSPMVTVSGRIAKQHGKHFDFGEQRPAQTLLLKLDTRLRTRLPDEDKCDSRGRDEIAIFDDPDKLAKWIGRRVTITGKLGRFGSALVYPSIYIEISTMRRFGARNTVYEGRKWVKP